MPAEKRRSHPQAAEAEETYLPEEVAGPKLPSAAAAGAKLPAKVVGPTLAAAAETKLAEEEAGMPVLAEVVAAAVAKTMEEAETNQEECHDYQQTRAAVAEQQLDKGK